MSENRELLTYDMAAKIIGANRRSLTRWVGIGVLTPVHVGSGRGKRTLFDRAEVVNLARKRSAGGHFWISGRYEGGHSAKVFRNADIAQKMVDGGMSLSEVADRLCISRQRVHQLLRMRDELRRKCADQADATDDSAAGT